jgi:hypothetical protein
VSCHCEKPIAKAGAIWGIENKTNVGSWKPLPRNSSEHVTVDESVVSLAET